MSGIMDKAKAAVGNFKDQESGKTGASGVAADGKERLAEYKKDKADDGKINYMQEGKDASKDFMAKK